ncbi:hypothetical protein D9611_005060 [Ephemerocybe angulata]|uniref:F-box domain-containing protein n=1 Tax=Ephemerocybe angulata TaxID=980116 RepID=A0A8H5B399_9AGAR|nr:hypothetical protein D9611_005060 [Tulosesus angulatus]
MDPIDLEAMHETAMEPAPHPLSPIDCLPVELLIKVLEIACMEDTNFLHLIASERNSLPPTVHVVMHVCKSWRSMVVEVKSLWKHSVVVDTCPPRHTLLTRDLDGYLRHFCEVAALYGAKLTHVQFNYNVDAGDDRMDQLFSTVLSYGDNRYASLKLVGDISRTPPLPVINLPSLQELYLRCPSSESPRNFTTFWVPILSRLTLYDSKAFYPHLRLPWGQLTHLSFGHLYTADFKSHNPTYDIRAIRVRELLTILQRLCNLSHLHLTGAIYRTSRSQPTLYQFHLSSPIPLLKLRVLEIHDKEAILMGTMYSFFLSAISTPNLENLDLIVAGRRPSRNAYFPLDRPVQNFEDFLRRAVRLRRLRVVLVPYDWTGVYQEVWKECYLKMQGDANFFEAYDGGINLEEDGALFSCIGKVIRRTAAPWPYDGIATTTERFIDRCLVPDEGSKEKYFVQNTHERASILAIFRYILGGKYGVEGGERAAYITIPK